jgi:hypothetical protein
MVNYQNGKIYAIKSKNTDKCYVGSTTKDLLCKRLAEHTALFKRWRIHKTSFFSSFFIIEAGDYSIELLEHFPCSSRNELTARERFHIANTNCINIQWNKLTDEIKIMNQDRLEEQNKIVQERRERKKEEKNKLKQLSLEFIQEKQKFEEYYQNLGKIS